MTREAPRCRDALLARHSTVFRRYTAKQQYSSLFASLRTSNATGGGALMYVCVCKRKRETGSEGDEDRDEM